MKPAFEIYVEVSVRRNLLNILFIMLSESCLKSCVGIDGAKVSHVCWHAKGKQLRRGVGDGRGEGSGRYFRSVPTSNARSRVRRRSQVVPTATAWARTLLLLRVCSAISRYYANLIISRLTVSVRCACNRDTVCVRRDRRELEVREIEKQKERERERDRELKAEREKHERDRIERERLEQKHRAEQAVHKHFEESLRLAHAKVSHYITYITR